MGHKEKKAVVLLSGGLDSATTLALAMKEDYCIFPLTIVYGQKHAWEINSAKRLVKFYGLKNHKIFNLDLSVFGGSALTDELEIPKNRSANDMNDDIPITYVPARNTVFLSIALAFAETRDASSIFLGVNAIDYSGYPDCRQEFIKAFESVANLGTKMGIEGTKINIHTPLIHMKKDEIIKTGIALGVDYSLTHSCYDPGNDGISCGACDACTLRKKGFQDAGLHDPLNYKNELQG